MTKLNDSRNAVLLENATLTWENPNEGVAESGEVTIANGNSVYKHQPCPKPVLSHSQISIQEAKEKSNSPTLHKIHFAIKKVRKLRVTFTLNSAGVGLGLLEIKNSLCFSVTIRLPHHHIIIIVYKIFNLPLLSPEGHRDDYQIKTYIFKISSPKPLTYTPINH